MATIFLESKDNPKIKHLRGLIEQNNYRKKQGQTVLEGTHLCLAWLKESRTIHSIFTTEHALEHPDFEDIFSKENIYDFEKKENFLLKEEVCYLFFNVFYKSTLIIRVSYKRNKN